MISSGLTIPPAGALNTAAAPRSLAAAGSRSLIPVTYGVDRLTALILNVLPKAGDANTLLVQCLWGHALDHVDEPRLNDQALPAGASITHFSGDQTVPDATLVAAFAAQGIAYEDTLEGYAWSLLQMPTRSFDGQLNVSARLWGRRMYDPRLDTTAGGSGSHRLADPSTWAWSDNPSLCLADWSANTLYGAGEPVAWASVPAAANANDATIGSPAEKRRVLGVSFSRDGVSVAAVAETLRAYAGCWLIPSADGLRLLPDADDAPVATYSHADGTIARLEALSLRDLGNAPTAVDITYTDTTQIPWREATATAALPGAGTTLPWRVSSVAMPGVQRYSQAYREAVERLNKLTLGDLAFELEVFDTGIRHEPGDIVIVSHPLGLTDKAMRVTNPEMTSLGRWRLQLAEHDGAAYSDEVQTAPSVTDTSRVLTGGPAADVDALAGTVTNGRITWTWAPAEDAGGVAYAATEVRDTDADWGAASPAPLFRGAASNWAEDVTVAGVVQRYARHFDIFGNPSTTSAMAEVEVTAGDLLSSAATFVIAFEDATGVTYTSGI